MSRLDFDVNKTSALDTSTSAFKEPLFRLEIIISKLDFKAQFNDLIVFSIHTKMTAPHGFITHCSTNKTP
jgi:hypothetical protein